MQNTLPLYEEKLSQLSADYEASKKLYAEDLISRAELENRERAMTNARLELQRVREWIAEDDVSLSLAENAVREKLAQVSKMNPGEYEESETLIRYSGTSNWSLSGAEKIAKFFQNGVADRCRSARWVSLQPMIVWVWIIATLSILRSNLKADPGRALMSFLRTNGIPFMAFRSRVLGMSTGAHIHVGRPSPRMLEVKQRSTLPPA